MRLATEAAFGSAVRTTFARVDDAHADECAVGVVGGVVTEVVFAFADLLYDDRAFETGVLHGLVAVAAKLLFHRASDDADAELPLGEYCDETYRCRSASCLRNRCNATTRTEAENQSARRATHAAGCFGATEKFRIP